MSQSWPSKYRRWPQYLSYPTPLQRSARPVPNSTAVNWPQSQFAPKYLPPGSASYQPYSYLRQAVPLTSIEPKMTHVIPPTFAYGSTMFATANPSIHPLHRKLVAALPYTKRAKIKRLEAKIRRLSRKSKKTLTEHNQLARLHQKHGRWRAILTQAYSAHSSASYSGAYGDGFAYELAPLQASPHNLRDYGIGSYSGVGSYGGCGCAPGTAKANCGCANNSPMGADTLKAWGIKDEEGKLTGKGWVLVALATGGAYYSYTTYA